MVIKILVAAMLFVVWFFVINIAWAEIFTIQRGYQFASIVGISGDEDVYDFIADTSLVISTIGACLFTFFSIQFLHKN